MKYTSVSPLTQEVLFQTDSINDEDLESCIKKSHSAFTIWKETSIEQRKSILPKLAQLLKKRKTDLAKISAVEMGKPITEGIAEVEKCAVLCEHYYTHAEVYAQPTVFDSQYSLHYVPMGIILSIMPWNFPYWQVFRAVIPAIIAGNVVLVKHAPNVPQCALAIAHLFADAGVEEGIYSNVFLSYEQINKLIADKRIQGVSLTGSTKAGIEVATRSAQYLKKVVLELGGSDAFIVTQHANLDSAIKVCMRSRFGNCGQSCIAAKRILVQAEVAQPFINALLEQIQSLKVGNPLVEDTQIGPMARKDLTEVAMLQIQDAIEKGALCLTGGKLKENTSNFVLPTLLTHVNLSMRVMQEEVFAPIASVYVFDNIQEAIEVANHTEYGLGASVWSQDREEAAYIASKLLAGNVFINGLVRSDPKYPFGGIKLSGVGKELSYYGMQEFCYPILRADLT
ncbi:MAG: NAD-dependent succinate-semialdehyde dehydrogenase [Bacteroidia bacterium]|nr:NAD-dependent succinate-semialdehyde dehydrogenase [Bacteroidia bacterium]MDW8347230.1 NAD-dependent succinate-semialdehyde dehydrogenase [Bacteroidia bacterium]